jgi:two-component system, OmpR family, response regulator QseB
MRVLLAEDDVDLGQGLASGLQHLGLHVDWVKDGISAEHGAMDGEGIDILVLDLGLPRQDGLTVLSKLRSAGNEIPVLILTARDAVEERVKGLDLGADDYLTKPFDLHELAARIRAILRRRNGRATSTIECAGLILDTASRSVIYKGADVPLSLHEFTILEYLLNHTGRVLSKQQIESSLYGWNDGVESNAVEVHIHHLRKKLGKHLIRTVRGLGYSIARENHSSDA